MGRVVDSAVLLTRARLGGSFWSVFGARESTELEVEARVSHVLEGNVLIDLVDHLTPLRRGVPSTRVRILADYSELGVFANRIPNLVCPLLQGLRNVGSLPQV
jgi:hypothetical protein